MSVNIKVTGGLNIEWGQIDPKATGGLNKLKGGERASEGEEGHLRFLASFSPMQHEHCRFPFHPLCAANREKVLQPTGCSNRDTHTHAQKNLKVKCPAALDGRNSSASLGNVLLVSPSAGRAGRKQDAAVQSVQTDFAS